MRIKLVRSWYDLKLLKSLKINNYFYKYIINIKLFL